MNNGLAAASTTVKAVEYNAGVYVTSPSLSGQPHEIAADAQVDSAARC